MKSEHKMIIDVYMSQMYDGNPQGKLLESIQELERKLIAYAEENPNSKDLLNDSGLSNNYTSLYMAVVSGNNDFSIAAEGEGPKVYDASTATHVPTVHEFLDTYRYVYENGVKASKRAATDAAYGKLFDVENRTDDIMEAQLIIEKEGLVLKTVTADYEAIAKDFLDAADPNYEITSAAVSNTIAKYAKATSLDEVVYFGELAIATCNDIATHSRLKVAMMLNFVALIFAWEHAKGRVRMGGKDMEANAKAMAVTRMKMRQYYKFLCDDMGITFEDMENNPFYRISLLNPTGLDELWRIKKVMHPDNIAASKYVLFNEILSDKSIGEILLSPQPVPYYKELDSANDSALVHKVEDEYEAITEELNKDIEFFQRNRRSAGKKPSSQEELIEKSTELNRSIGGNSGSPSTGAGGIKGMASAFSSGMKSMKGSGMGGSMAGAVVGSMAKSAVTGAAGNFLRGISGVGEALSIGRKVSRGAEVARDVGSVASDVKDAAMSKENGKDTDSTKDAAKKIGKSIFRGLFRL